jgi:hypothetical protein
MSSTTGTPGFFATARTRREDAPRCRRHASSSRRSTATGRIGLIVTFAGAAPGSAYTLTDAAASFAGRVTGAPDGGEGEPFEGRAMPSAGRAGTSGPGAPGSAPRRSLDGAENWIERKCYGSLVWFLSSRPFPAPRLGNEAGRSPPWVGFRVELCVDHGARLAALVSRLTIERTRRMPLAICFSSRSKLATTLGPQPSARVAAMNARE